MNKTAFYILTLTIVGILSPIVSLNLRSKQGNVDFSKYKGSFDGYHVLYNMTEDYDKVDCIKYSRTRVPLGKCSDFSAFKEGHTYHKGNKVTDGLGVFESLEDNNTTNIDNDNVCLQIHECSVKGLKWRLINACGGTLNISRGKQSTENLEF